MAITLMRMLIVVDMRHSCVHVIFATIGQAKLRNR